MEDEREKEDGRLGIHGVNQNKRKEEEKAKGKWGRGH